VIYDAEGKFLDQWGEYGHRDDQLNGPAGIAFDSNDNVYIADQHSNSIKKFSSDGQFIGLFGREDDAGEEHLDQPWGVAVDSEDNVYVADWRHDAVKKYSASGEHVATYGGLQDDLLHRPSGVAVDSAGYLYVTDWGNERLQVLGPDGSLHATERGQATLSQWAKEFFESNPDETAVREISNLIPELPPQLSDDPYHVSSQTEPYFWGPVAVAVDNEDRVYVVESNRHRFQIFKRA